jgi:hypothetical protein
MARILIGTSGSHYDSWRGPFFPRGLPLKHQLQYYANQFQTTAAICYRLQPRHVPIPCGQKIGTVDEPVGRSASASLPGA